MRDGRATREAPTILPGQVWRIEHDPRSALSELDCDALAQADVVLYDRALAPLVAEILPLGGYAEPLSFTDVGLGPRALELADQGWSVVQLVAAPASRCAQLHTSSISEGGVVAPSLGPTYAFTANGLAG